MHTTTASAVAPPFTNAKAALRFAVNFKGSPAKPFVTRMMGGRLFVVSEYAGLDGAAQAGMIINAVGDLPRLHLSMLFAGSAHPMLPCDCNNLCCSGKKVNLDWLTALEEIRRGSDRDLKMIDREVRRLLIARFYGRNVTLVKLAYRFNIHLNTICRYHKLLHTWLTGSRDYMGQDVKAWMWADERLRDVGIIG
ncbi:MAG: hypothetical protein KGL39_24615 [Patescibacteria group bacterium]|nr:hypothetical protein [Patescibacteria group bacterium]